MRTSHIWCSVWVVVWTAPYRAPHVYCWRLLDRGLVRQRRRHWRSLSAKSSVEFVYWSELHFSHRSKSRTHSTTSSHADDAHSATSPVRIRGEGHHRRLASPSQVHRLKSVVFKRLFKVILLFVDRSLRFIGANFGRIDHDFKVWSSHFDRLSEDNFLWNTF